MGRCRPIWEAYSARSQFLGVQQSDSARISLWHAGCSFGIVVVAWRSKGSKVGVKGETIR